MSFRKTPGISLKDAKLKVGDRFRYFRFDRERNRWFMPHRRSCATIWEVEKLVKRGAVVVAFKSPFISNPAASPHRHLAELTDRIEKI